MSFLNKLTPKTKRIINIVVDVIVAIILAFALLLAICAISSKAKKYDQYTEIFGSAYLAVESQSMEPTFKKGDLIKIKTVDGDKAKSLKVGQVITFKTNELTQDRKTVLNTHRIIEVINNDGNISYRTQGDNNSMPDSSPIEASKVVGVYQGKAGGIGKVMLFMNTSTGFFVCVVLPTLLIVVYCAVNLVLVIRKEKKKQTVEAAQAQLDERERIRQELLAEMQGNVAETASPAEPQEEVKQEPQEQAETQPEPEQETTATEEPSTQEDTQDKEEE